MVFRTHWKCSAGGKKGKRRRYPTENFPGLASGKFQVSGKLLRSPAGRRSVGFMRCEEQFRRVGRRPIPFDIPSAAPQQKAPLAGAFCCGEDGLRTHWKFSGGGEKGKRRRYPTENFPGLAERMRSQSHFDSHQPLQERSLICLADKSGFFQLYSPAASYIALQLYSAYAE